jgi:di/tricarboxylate transporter
MRCDAQPGSLLTAPGAARHAGGTARLDNGEWLLLMSFTTLVMSNVGATALLVPLAVNIARAVRADPAVFALTVAIATSNSFLIPTHQVNAPIMGPAGYRVPDFMRAGGVMTLLFLVVTITVMALLF